MLEREANQKYTKEQSEEAIRLAPRAIEADPGYAKAYMTRSDSYTSLAMVTGDFAWPSRTSKPTRAKTLAFCWSHGRRQFFEIHQSSQSPIAGEVLRRIAELYHIK